MPSIVPEIRSIMELAGFATFAPRPDSSFLYFEDVSVMGHVHVLETAELIVQTWEAIQDDFLRNNAPRFAKDATKAWNLYTVLLSTEAASADMAPMLFAIEEDFRGTRKIARSGVVSRDDILVALGPLLPLNNLVSVGPTDARQRLLDRLGAANPALKLVLTESRPDAIVAALTSGAQ